jgi:fatty acid desaturase
VEAHIDCHAGVEVTINADEPQHQRRPLVDVFMGGLNHQVEHHLYPSMPRPHLRKPQPLLAAYCVAQQIPYTQTTLWQSYGIITRYLNTVGLGHRDPFLCPLVASRRAS